MAAVELINQDEKVSWWETILWVGGEWEVMLFLQLTEFCGLLAILIGKCQKISKTKQNKIFLPSL